MKCYEYFSIESYFMKSKEMERAVEFEWVQFLNRNQKKFGEGGKEGHFLGPKFIFSFEIH
jgi:hypothetical protein